MADFIHYHRREDDQPEFVERVLAHQADSLFWFCPGPANRQNLLSIMDAGVRVVILNDRTMAVPGQSYLLRWEPALQRALRRWKQAGIQHLELPHSLPRPGTATHLLERVAAAVGLPVQARRPEQDQLADYVAQLGVQPRTGVVFDDDLWHATLCGKAPQAMAALMGRARTLVMHSLHMDPGACGAARVDLLAVDWVKMARQIAEDFGNGQVFNRAEPLTFSAVYRAGVPAAELARDFDRE